MNSKIVLIVGFLAVALYIKIVTDYVLENDKKKDTTCMVQKTKIADKKVDNKVQKKEKEENSKFLYLLKKDKVEIVSKLSNVDRNSSLIFNISRFCENKSCDNNIEFADSVKSDARLIKLLEKLLMFIDKHNLTKASIVINNNIIEINFLLNNEEELKELKKIYRDYITKYTIEDKSSIVQVYNIAAIEKKINKILKKAQDKINIKKDKEILKEVFLELEKIGNVKITFCLKFDNEKHKIKKMIEKDFPWVKEVEFKKCDENKILIKEVLA